VGRLRRGAIVLVTQGAAPLSHPGGQNAENFFLEKPLKLRRTVPLLRPKWCAESEIETTRGWGSVTEGERANRLHQKLTPLSPH
jgi:hypothetical protein